MKVFLSYAHDDLEFVERLKKALTQEGHDVWMDLAELKPGANIFSKVQEGIEESDYVITVLSPSYSKSSWGRLEYQSFARRELVEDRTFILPILIEDAEIPTFLQDRVYADFRTSFNRGMKAVLAALGQDGLGPTPEDAKRIAREGREAALDSQVRKIREQYVAGRLCLFCGAGVSAGAGFPMWSMLLRTLLAGLFSREVPEAQVPEKLAESYQDYFGPSALMVAQYLKNGLGDEFVTHVRDALYASAPQSSDLVDAIVELCRPQRSRQSLHSIITFNFDELIEENLAASHIRHVPIFTEGQRPGPAELPVYHAHGFLPRSGKLGPEHTVVFAEDAYHSQFLDPFSWSNLAQLNHLNSDLCLLVGLSVTDPNLRRLLDVSMRKNPDRTLNHYVFKKAYDIPKIAADMRGGGLNDVDERHIHDFVRAAQLLEEQDANNLGMHVIWVDDYSEIPAILRRIGAD